MEVTPLLAQFGLTGQEARIYEAMHEYEQATGYELSKATGISRSNTYAALNSLSAKGCARLIDGKPARYQVVPVSEFCSMVLRSLQAAQRKLEELLHPVSSEEAPYLTIKGGKNIINKINHMLARTEHRVYLSMSSGHLEHFLDALFDLAALRRKVVIITDSPMSLPGVIIHMGNIDPRTVRVITDSSIALTGEISTDADSSCLYSRKPNLVTLLKDSIRNEIALIELKKRQ